MTLEHAGEAVADLFARVADGDRPRDVGGSVGKLAARIDEIAAVRMDLPIVLRRRFIVGTRAIGVCRRDRRERHAMKPCCRATEPGDAFGRGPLGLLTLRRFASMPVPALSESGDVAELRLL